MVSSFHFIIIIIIIIIINGSMSVRWALAAFPSFLIIYTVGRIPWAGDQLHGRSLATHNSTQTPNPD
jgi:hypothetical protein